MSEKEQRARAATYELQITEEACAKLRQHWIEQAIDFAANAKPEEAHNMLLQVKALDTIRMMVRVPIDDWQIEKSLTEAKAAQPAQPN